MATEQGEGLECFVSSLTLVLCSRPMKEDEIKKSAESQNETERTLAQELLKVRNAIRQHRDKTGHELCWLNDFELWKVLGEDARYPHDSLPVREEFLKQCSVFYESRLKGTKYAEPGVKKKIAE